jgi:uncharacterized protein with HEPN domain
MRPEARKFLYDVQKACGLLAQFTAGRNLTEYRADALLRSAVERQFEIIGEAMGQMLRLDPGLVDTITHAPRIIAFRNILIHGYAAITPEVVWDVVERDLPRLCKEVAALLDAAGA